MSARRAAAALILAGCSGASLPGVSGLPVEALARVGAQALPIGAEMEAEIGTGIAAVVLGRYPLDPDEALQRYVDLVGRTVAVHSPRAGEVPFRFAVLASEDVNAFAAPGGFVFVTRGALARMEDEAELAGVLAHEVAHVDERHVLEQVRRSAVLRTVRSEAQLTGALLDQVSAAGTGLLFTGLGRRDEMEADSLGLLYARAAGYDPGGLARFLARLEGAQAGAGGEGAARRLAEWRASHPDAAERIEALGRQLGAGEGGARMQERFRRFVRAP
jgi:beta-barrel assembly-enhancing protease